ncbi:hypothetical protein CSV61_16110 [Sporosarcina sp. P3]|uniref:hypothetical protein n=1 Tax=Sporosarcina sp. P3 TaxID=2048245 RepID=UPI000C165524|nr:hypothetical protein [Sporosarcina sp. P3]PID20172.1 hypothetical protein CSV61_16110 [Sporosarcina sp. P3]
MNKNEWFELFTKVFNTGPSRIDYLMLAITTISSLGVVVTGIFTFLAARAARDAVKANITIYNDDKRERELLLSPIFEVQNAGFGVDTSFDLVNVNIQHPVSITSIGLNIEEKIFTTKKVSNNVMKFNIEKYHMNEQELLLITLFYTALNHRRYKITLNVRRDTSTIFIDNITTHLIEN